MSVKDNSRDINEKFLVIVIVIKVILKKNRYKYEDLLCLIFNYKIKILKIGGGKGEVSGIYMICCICIFMKFYEI